MKNFKAMSDMVADAEDLLGRLSDAGGPEVQALKTKLERSIEEVQGVVSAQAKQARDKTQETWSAVRNYMEGNPWVGVAAIAALAGCLVLAFARRADR